MSELAAAAAATATVCQHPLLMNYSCVGSAGLADCCSCCLILVRDTPQTSSSSSQQQVWWVCCCLYWICNMISFCDAIWWVIFFSFRLCCAFTSSRQIWQKVGKAFLMYALYFCFMHHYVTLQCEHYRVLQSEGSVCVAHSEEVIYEGPFGALEEVHQHVNGWSWNPKQKQWLGHHISGLFRF